MASELVSAQITPGPHIFHWPGRGRDRLARSLAYLMECYGQHILLADVRQCFASVAPDAIATLNLLPLELVRNALDYRSLKLRRYEPPAGDPVWGEEPEKTAPRGLLEGSAASNPLAAALFNDLPSHLDIRVVPLTFGDNIAVVAASEEECSHAEEDLVRYFADHFAGPFSLTRSRYGPGESFEFLGYAFDPQPDGTVTVAHSDANWAKSLRRLYTHPDVRSWGTPDEIADDLLRGFPAVSEDWREALIVLAADEIDAAARGIAG